jgi:Gpi18-like mannosyltransferase
MGFTAMVVAGIVLGLATGVRSNGILTGVTLLVDAATTGLAILNQGFSRPKLLRLASVVVAGLLVGAGLVLPQVLAYQEYCSDPLATSRRPWCDFMVPSIFTWVQSHYW